MGYEVVQELVSRKENVLVIEKDPENRFLELVRSQGVKTFVGDASVAKVLRDAGAQNACGLFSLINDDLKNLEIGLNARALRPNLRLILRVFDKEIAEQLRIAFDIHFAMSTSAIAAEEFASLFSSVQRESAPGKPMGSGQD
jgi:Trk K+ transport system NAD-binding subunit